MEEFGKRLKYALEKRGMYKYELADKVFVSDTCIGKYIKGKTFPQIETFIRICDVLNVSADWLLGRK